MDTRLVTDFFRHDHDRLEQLFQKFYDARAAGSRKAANSFQRLRLTTDRHLG